MLFGSAFFKDRTWTLTFQDPQNSQLLLKQTPALFTWCTCTLVWICPSGKGLFRALESRVKYLWHIHGPQGCQAGGEGFKLNLPEEGNLSPCHSYQFDACVGNRCPEPGEGSARECLKCGIKEFQPLQIVSWLHSGPRLNVSIQDIFHGE